MIPFHLRLYSPDQQALDLFATRGSLTFALIRTLYIQSTAIAGDTNKSDINRTNKIFTRNVGNGAYWPADDNDTKSKNRKLDGEIPVRADLKPSFVFPNTSIKVILVKLFLQCISRN